MKRLEEMTEDEKREEWFYRTCCSPRDETITGHLIENLSKAKTEEDMENAYTQAMDEYAEKAYREVFGV